MVVVGHLAVRVHHKFEPVASLAEDGEPSQAIAVGAIDPSAPIAARGDVVERVVKLNAKWAIHEASVAPDAGTLLGLLNW